MVHTILGSLIGFLFQHKADIASKIAASAGYDLLKKTLNFKALSEKIKGYFRKPEEPDQFIDSVVHDHIKEGETPAVAMGRAFTELTGDSMPAGLLETVTTWLKENEQSILQVTTANFTNVSGFAIGSQFAQGNIQNIQGDMTVNNGQKD